MKTKNEELENNAQKEAISKIKIPSVKEFTKDEIIEMYKDEIKKKDKLILELQNENKLLLDLTIKNTKRKLEELENKINESEKN